MTFTERYEDIIKTKDYFEKEYNGDYSIENNIINELDILVTGHFGNAVSIQMICDNIIPMTLYNSTDNIGYIIRAIIELFDKEDDNSVNINELKGTPIRIVFDSKNPWGSKAIAIGHFMKNRFILIEDLMKVEK